MPHLWLLSISCCILIPGSLFAQWEYVGCPETGAIINFDTDMDRVYVLTNPAIYYSDDKTETWQTIALPDEVIHPEEIQVENGILYLSASSAPYNQHTNILLRSDNDGETWTDISGFSDSNQFINYFICKEDTIIIVRADTLSLSFNKGEYYQSFISPVYLRKIIHHGNRIFGLDWNCILESFDFGFSWDTVYKSSTTLIYDLNLVDGGLWISENLDADEHINIKLSYNFGKTWLTVFDMEDSKINQPGVIGDSGRIFIIDNLSADAIYASTNGGYDWTFREIDNSYSTLIYHKDILLAWNGRKVYVSNDNGGTFQTHHNGFKAATITSFTSHGNNIWVNDYSETYKQSGVEWEFISGLSHLSSTQDGHLLARVSGHIRTSSDGGQNWTIVPPSALNGYPTTYHNLSATGNLMYIIDVPFEGWFSTDYGIEWHEQGTSELRYIRFNEKYLAFKHYDAEVLISEDGIAWQNITFNLIVHPLSVKLLHYHQGTIFVSSREGFFRLPVLQKTWGPIEPPVPFHPDYPGYPPITAMESNENLLIVGMYGYGIFISEDNGDNWHEVNEGLTNKRVLSSKIIKDEIYIGVEGGVWKRPLSELIITDVAEPGNNLSFSVHPVPSSDFIHVDFETREVNSPVTISLFDVNGILIRSTIEDDPTNIHLDIRENPTGIYFLKVYSGHQTGWIKVVKI